MDMMELRFRMMAMLGGSAMVGELSQYKQIKVTPDNANWIAVQNPFTIRPKIVIVSCASDSDAATSRNRLFEGILKLFDAAGGQLIYKNANDANTTAGYMVEDQSTSNSRIGIYTVGDVEAIQINRASSSIVWSTTTEYTLDIYG